jgi:hypothetical protein
MALITLRKRKLTPSPSHKASAFLGWFRAYDSVAINMNEVSSDELKKAVESQHGGIATFAQSVPVKEMHGDQVAWEGTVHVFDLAGHPKAKRAYAWSYALDDGRRRFFTVLHALHVTSPRDAVRAAIVAEQRRKMKPTE